jgi:hypothetical protein
METCPSSFSSNLNEGTLPILFHHHHATPEAAWMRAPKNIYIEAESCGSNHATPHFLLTHRPTKSCVCPGVMSSCLLILAQKSSPTIAAAPGLPHRIEFKQACLANKQEKSPKKA